MATARDDVSFAVRSSATAEDLPDASFAGQQETFLNIKGIDDVLQAIREVFASLYNDRAIAYRVHHDFDHDDVALSAGVQRMVRSDVGASGVMFTMDTESGFHDAVFVTSSYGLGEAVVQGAVNPDEFYVYKPALRGGPPGDPQARRRATRRTKMIYTDDPRSGRTIEFVDTEEAERAAAQPHRRRGRGARPARPRHREALRPPDGHRVGQGRRRRRALHPAGAPGDGEVARPACSQRVPARREAATVVVEGRAIGQKIGAGGVRVMTSIDQMHEFIEGDVLVADMTDPDWEPIMKRASAIVTNRGGRTCHAAIIARELGIPAVVGTGDATRVARRTAARSPSPAPRATPATSTTGCWSSPSRRPSSPRCRRSPAKIMMNVGTPEQAFAFAQLPNAGVGLARLEFIINRQIGIHPKALLGPRRPRGAADVAEITETIAAYASPREYFVKRLAEGVSTIAAAFAPEPVIVRMSDFKSNEYANLIGGGCYEPHEENPMIGFRGASRYSRADFADCFAMECRGAVASSATRWA